MSVSIASLLPPMEPAPLAAPGSRGDLDFAPLIGALLDAGGMKPICTLRPPSELPIDGTPLPAGGPVLPDVPAPLPVVDTPLSTDPVPAGPDSATTARLPDPSEPFAAPQPRPAAAEFARLTATQAVLLTSAAQVAPAVAALPTLHGQVPAAPLTAGAAAPAGSIEVGPHGREPVGARRHTPVSTPVGTLANEVTSTPRTFARRQAGDLMPAPAVAVGTEPPLLGETSDPQEAASTAPQRDADQPQPVVTAVPSAPVASPQALAPAVDAPASRPAASTPATIARTLPEAPQTLVQPNVERAPVEVEPGATPSEVMVTNASLASRRVGTASARGAERQGAREQVQPATDATRPLARQSTTPSATTPVNGRGAQAAEPLPRHPGPFDAASGVAQGRLEPGSRFSLPQKNPAPTSAPAAAPIALAPDPSVFRAAPMQPLPISPADQDSGTPAQGRGDGVAVPLAPVATAVTHTPAREATPTPSPAPVAGVPTPRQAAEPADAAFDGASEARPQRRSVSPVTPRAVAAAAPAILPAAQAFGAALQTAWATERKLAPAIDQGAPVAATAAPAQPALEQTVPTVDTADRRWPHAMAAQIERLRDAADETSTRIRLLPDALGPVDVAVRREGETVHVHFTAAQPETRQLLADAQPRLAEAADARGVRLGRTDVSGGDLPQGDRQQQRAFAQPSQPLRPAPARTRADASDPTDTRIA